MRIEGMEIVNVHFESVLCLENNCTIHSRSNHSLRVYPQFFDPIIRAMFRICAHRQFHVDPDELERMTIAYACTNCCGCCK